MRSDFLKYVIVPFVALLILAGCDSTGPTDDPKPAKFRKTDYIRKIEGKSDSIPLEEARRGKVLIAYSDCYTCHTTDKRAKGPAFQDIAKRYPVNNGYIELLALKIIKGGSGAWGYPVMLPHPDLPKEDARTMAKYILSLKKS
jgi:cytochrome c